MHSLLIGVGNPVSYPLNIPFNGSNGGFNIVRDIYKKHPPVIILFYALANVSLKPQPKLFNRQADIIKLAVARARKFIA